MASVVDCGNGRRRLTTEPVPEALVDDFVREANAVGMPPDRLLAQLVRGFIERRRSPRNRSRWP